jgi:hypothetical protein
MLLLLMVILVGFKLPLPKVDMQLLRQVMQEFLKQVTVEYLNPDILLNRLMAKLILNIKSHTKQVVLHPTTGQRLMLLNQVTEHHKLMEVPNIHLSILNTHQRKPTVFQHTCHNHMARLHYLLDGKLKWLQMVDHIMLITTIKLLIGQDQCNNLISR